MFDSLVRSAATAPDPSEVDDRDLVELIGAWERLACRAAAGQLAAIAELARRRPRDLADRPPGPTGPLSAGGPAVAGDAGHPGVPEVSEFAVDEVAAALRLSRPAAGVRLHTAVELTRLPATAAALRAGELDLPKVRAVVDAVSVLETSIAGAVEARVLPRAGRQTVGQLRASLSRAVLAVDPPAAERRHERAVEERQVTVRPSRDGMAELWALLPADSAVALYSRIDHLARCAPTGDPRGMDARRADALVAAVLTHSITPTATMAAALTSPPTPARSMAPAWSAAPAPSAAPAWSAAPASSTVPTGLGAANASSATTMPAAGETVGRAASSECIGWETDGSAGPAERPVVSATVHVTVPAATALGLDEEPGELAGHGPVPASMARRLAATGTWRKVTTDPVSGVVTGVHRRAYTPSAALADLVRARDRTCRFPGCRQPARRCDLDHVVRWPEGPTEAANLAALCRHHHRLKHQTQWTVQAGSDADLVWTAPTGHRYVTSPAP